MLTCRKPGGQVVATRRVVVDQAREPPSPPAVEAPPPPSSDHVDDSQCADALCLHRRRLDPAVPLAGVASTTPRPEPPARDRVTVGPRTYGGPMSPRSYR